jgi:hypothetical protein
MENRPAIMATRRLAEQRLTELAGHADTWRLRTVRPGAAGGRQQGVVDRPAVADAPSHRRRIEAGLRGEGCGGTRRGSQAPTAGSFRTPQRCRD